MKKTSTPLNRRSFFASSALTGLCISVPALASHRLASHRLASHRLASHRLANTAPLGNRVVITQVTWEGTHPVMDNPHYRSQEQVDALVEKARRINAATGIKLMGLQHFLKQPIEWSAFRATRN
ncbi:hypothetical protein OAE63_00840 [bacterium]|nr:hypothetical protein [bacterium]